MQKELQAHLDDVWEDISYGLGDHLHPRGKPEESLAQLTSQLLGLVCLGHSGPAALARLSP